MQFGSVDSCAPEDHYVISWRYVHTGTTWWICVNDTSARLWVDCAKTAELIVMPFRRHTLVGPRNRVGNFQNNADWRSNWPLTSRQPLTSRFPYFTMAMMQPVPKLVGQSGYYTVLLSSHYSMLLIMLL